MQNILECHNLNKKLGNKQILKNVSFNIEAGDILAFIGPNGSGKTTTIKLILGLQSIDSGAVYINGFDIKKDYVKAIRKVGALVESPDVYMYLTGYQNLKLMANYYENIKEEKLREVIKFVGLENRIHDKVSKYSLGMRQRLGIARSLLHDPNLLILDEPTNGLDPEGIKDLRILLKKLAKAGIGILISSHNLAELESFCNKVCIIDNGEIKEFDNVKNFKHLDNRFFFAVSKTDTLKIERMEKVTKNSFEITATKEEVAQIIRKIVQANVDIYEVKELEMTLEEAFLKKAGGNKIV